MAELYKPSEFLICPDSHQFSPDTLEGIRLQLAENNIDLETWRGMQFFIRLSQQLYSPTDPDHGWLHILDVIEHTHNIADIHNVNDREYYALMSAACLHDVIRYGVENPAVLSAQIAEIVLAPHMSPQTLELAVNAIADHSSGAEKRSSKKGRVGPYFYDGDKKPTSRYRWELWGLNPKEYTQTSIEDEYRTFLDLVMGTVVTHYTSDTIEYLMLEQEALKNASGY